MRFPRLSSLAAAIATTGLLASAPPVHAAIPAGDRAAEAVFSQFVDSLHVAPRIEAALEKKFSELTPAAQAQLLASPTGLMTTGQETTTNAATTAPAASTLGVAAAAKGLRVTNNQPVRVLGITVGNFHLSYTYEATSTTVTRNLECVGSWSGFGLAGSSSASRYITGGRGTCNVRHQMTYVFRGSPIQFTKLHTVTTVSGNPRKVTGSLRTV